MMTMNEYCQWLEDQGADPAMYRAALAALPTTWTRVSGSETCHLVAGLYEAGLVEKRRVEDFRENGSLRSSFAEFRRIA